MNAPAEELIFSPSIAFTDKAIQLFHFQYAHNELYKRYVDSINCKPHSIERLEDIPFLPISFFKTHFVAATAFQPKVVFQSSGTTGSTSSKHFVKDISLYERSFIKAFESFYGKITDYCILGLLPSYLERSGSSLVYMVEKMLEISRHSANNFYLHNHHKLFETLQGLQEAKQKTLLIGVTYALLDFAEKFSTPLKNTIIMETGGMKGRKKELLRQEVHDILKQAFNQENIHSEYGMTELLSQAYATRNGIFQTPATMKALLREEDDPFAITASTSRPITGVLNIIDLANVYSCSFIATDDIGKLYPDGSFEVLGRMDNSDIRGCSLMVV